MEIIDQIRQAANIIDIASQYTTIRKRGSKHVGLCPFHTEKTPSFTLDEDKQLFHCFGCGAGGDVFTLVMEKEDLSFPEALRYLAQKYNIPLPEKKKLSPQYQKLEEMLHKISESALAYFRKNLFNTGEGRKALDYLKKRKISEETIQKLKIGYALNSWDSLLSFFSRKGIPPDQLEKAGLALRRQKKEGYYDRFRGRIIFPIFTLTGKTVAFGGRSLFNEEPKYLNSPDTPIYTKGNLLYGLNLCKKSIQEAGEMILVEGYTDFLALFQAGLKNIAASLGTSVTANQVSLALRFSPRMIISYDADIAGEKAALRAVSICFEKGVQAKVLTLPSNHDPDSYIQKFGIEKYKEEIEKCPTGLQFLIDIKSHGKKMDVPEVKAKIAREVVQEINKISDPVVRSEQIKRTAESMEIEEGLLRSMIKQKPKEKSDQSKAAFLPAEKRLLQIFWEDTSIASKIFEEIEENDLKGLKSAPILDALAAFFKKGKKLSPHEIKKKIDPSLFSSLSEVLQENSQPPSIQEARDCFFTLKKLSLERRCREINAQIAKLEKSKEMEKIAPYLKEKQAITEELSLLAQHN
jgi:DNA primase